MLAHFLAQGGSVWMHSWELLFDLDSGPSGPPWGEFSGLLCASPEPFPSRSHLLTVHCASIFFLKKQGCRYADGADDYMPVVFSWSIHCSISLCHVSLISGQALISVEMPSTDIQRARSESCAINCYWGNQLCLTFPTDVRLFHISFENISCFSLWVGGVQ